MKTTIPRTINIISNNNISFPIGTTLAVQNYSSKLGFESIFSRFKQRGISLPNLVDALIYYRLTENQSLSRGSDWINRIEVLEEFGLD
jgi:hypothetical protein